MRYGKMASQLGSHQFYYISRYVHEKQQSIQLTITIIKDDKKHVEERRKLIKDIIKLLNDIMKVFMPATKETLSILIPCPHCSCLHISLADAYSGKDIFCSNSINGIPLSLRFGYYKDLLQGELADAAAIAGEVVGVNYCLLLYLLQELIKREKCSLLITAGYAIWILKNYIVT